uniref:Uncharacterized protein n=1 Tax=Arundo donax TaxID=35708 RepID=A0A0A8Y2F5_ARUDO
MELTPHALAASQRLAASCPSRLLPALSFLLDLLGLG